MIERERLIKEVTALQNHQDVSESFLEEIRDDLCYYISKIVNDQTLAEDLTQDTLVEILTKIDNLQEPAAFVSWSKKIAYHKCTDYFKVRHEILLDEFEDGTSIFDTLEDTRGEFLPEETVEKEDLKQELHAMIMELPEDQRSAILLRYFDELSVKEISETHGVSEGTIKSRLNYARKALKKAVENYEKKNGIKLRCVGIIPLLLWLFRQYRLEAKVPLTKPNVSGQFFGTATGKGAVAATMAGGSSASASAAAATATTTATTAAAMGHGVAGILGLRTIIGIIIGIVIIGIGILIPVIGNQPEPPVTEPTVIRPTESTAPETTVPGTTVPGTTETEETDPTETTVPETGETPTMPADPTDPSEEETPTMPADPTDPAPTDPGPTDPDPTEPDPTEPDPTEPAPTQPAPTEPEEPEPTPPPGETPTMPIDPPPEDETPTMPL